MMQGSLPKGRIRLVRMMMIGCRAGRKELRTRSVVISRGVGRAMAIGEKISKSLFALTVLSICTTVANL